MGLEPVQKISQSRIKWAVIAIVNTKFTKKATHAPSETSQYYIFKIFIVRRMSIVIWSNSMHTKFRRVDDTCVVVIRGRRIATYDNVNNRTTQLTKGQKTKVHHLFYRFDVFASSVFIGYFLFCGRGFSLSRMKKSKRRPNSIKFQLHVIKRIICRQSETEWDREKTVNFPFSGRKSARTSSSSSQPGHSLIFESLSFLCPAPLMRPSI